MIRRGTGSERRRGPLGDERGAALVMAVIAMVVLGIMAVSFTALGGLEVRIGQNDLRGKQALMAAEAALQALRSQVQVPPDFTNFLGNTYTCSPGGCSCITGPSGVACQTTRLAAVSTGTFTARLDNDPADPNPAVDGNQMVLLTALGSTTDGRGRARVRAWLVRDDPWKHVCSSDDGVRCSDPPNDPNATITPRDVEDLHGPRTYAQIPVPGAIRCSPVAGAGVNVGGDNYPVPSGVTVPAAPRGPCVMYPYYLTALTTPCPTQCNPATSAYDPTTCHVGVQCLGMVRLDASLSIQTSSGGPAVLQVAGGILGTAAAPALLYIMGAVTVKNNIVLNGTLVLHGDGNTGKKDLVDLTLLGTTVFTTQPPTCATCGYPLAILAYNPNEPAGAQSIWLNNSNQNTTIQGIVYSGGRFDFNPSTVTGSVVAHTVGVNAAATSLTYSSAYGSAAPPPGFTSPPGSAVTLIPRGTWLECRQADSLTAVCD